MNRFPLIFLTVLLAGSPLAAQSLIAARTIPARSVLEPADVRLAEASVRGAHTRIADVVGQEAQITIYAGRPVHVADIGPAALVDRNDIVTLSFRKGPLVIETEGRALDRASAGAKVRVMNMTSRATVIGRVVAPGRVEVGR